MPLEVALLVRAIGRSGEKPRALRAVEAGRLCAWVDDVPSAMDRAALLEHHRVVEGLGECLPARFGTVVEGEAALAELLRSREAELLGRLDLVRGKRELAVTGVWTAVEPGEPEGGEGGGPGRRYMAERRARMKRKERARAIAEQVARAAGVAEGHARHVVGPSDGVAFSSALLVPAEDAAYVKSRIEALELPEVRLLVHGVWPPYTFAG